MNKAELNARKKRLLLEGEVLRLQLLKDKLQFQHNLRASHADGALNIRCLRGIRRLFNQGWLNQPQILNTALLLLTRWLPAKRNSLLTRLLVPLLRGLIVLNALRKSNRPRS